MRTCETLQHFRVAGLKLHRSHSFQQPISAYVGLSKVKIARGRKRAA